MPGGVELRGSLLLQKGAGSHLKFIDNDLPFRLLKGVSGRHAGEAQSARVANQRHRVQYLLTALPASVTINSLKANLLKDGDAKPLA